MNKTKNTILAEQVLTAKSFRHRAVGLLSHSELPKHQTLWLHRCRDIHTCFMKFAIDVIFVDKNLTVTKVIENLKPWRFAFNFAADSVFEFQHTNGQQLDVEVGDQLYVGH